MPWCTLTALCYHYFAECPVSDEDDYRIEVLISLRRLERLDKDEYTDDERQEAEEVSGIFLEDTRSSILSGPICRLRKVLQI